MNKVPQKVQNFIDRYFNLELGGKKVTCPYYINNKKFRQRMGLRVLIGKGNPNEIEKESLIYEKLRGVDFNNMTEEEIREFLRKSRIGIDCSGFVVHVLDKWLRLNKKRHLWKYIRYPRQSLYRKIARWLRPVENISAKILTNDENTIKVKNLNNVKPGDLIRYKLPKRGKSLQEPYHVMLITEVKKEKGRVEDFTFVNSTMQYGEGNGVRYGKVIVTDPRKSLCNQKIEDYYDGENFTKESLCSNEEFSQVRKLVNVPLN